MGVGMRAERKTTPANSLLRQNEQGPGQRDRHFMPTERYRPPGYVSSPASRAVESIQSCTNKRLNNRIVGRSGWVRVTLDL